MSMEVKIELGHKAWKNIKPTKEGYTHDWTVFVQGVNGNEIKHIVEKVIFQLPDHYHDSKRIKEKPPFVISESTSKSISIQIDVLFCTEAKLKKVNYIYDIQISDEVVNISWMRKLTFPNPSKEFKEKLFLAGGELVELQEPHPMLTGGLLKCKVEPEDEIKIPDDVDATTLNTTAQKFDNFKKLLEQNENPQSANAEIREKISFQEKLKAFYEENFSDLETRMLKTDMGVKRLKKKVEDDEKEISALKLEMQMLQNELLQLKNRPTESIEEKMRGTKRKNEEDINISIAVGKEKENVTESTNFIPPPTRDDSNTSQISSFHKNTSVSAKNQNISEATTSVNLNASLSKTAASLNDIFSTLSGNCFLSQSKNNNQSVNHNPIHLQNLRENENLETLDCHRNIASVFTDVQKSVEENPVKADTPMNEPDMRNKDADKSVCGNLMEANSYLNTPDVIIIDAEKSSKRNSAKADDSLNTPEIITIDCEKSRKRNYNCQKLPKKEKSKKGRKIVEGSSLEAATSVSSESGTKKIQEQFDTPVQKHNISLLKRTNLKTSNSNCKENDQELDFFGDIALNPNNHKRLKRKIKRKWKKHFKRYSTNVNQGETVHVNSICKESHQDIEDTSLPKLAAFLTEHCQTLAPELDRIKNSEFRKYREGTNSLFSKLARIDTDPITVESCKQYLKSLINYFTNPEIFDMATLIYMIVDYLCHDRAPPESLPTYNQNHDTFVFLTPSENCIISALYEVDQKSLPHLNGLVRNTLNIIQQVIISKKKLAVNGLASLCRVFMEISRRNIDRWKPLFLCCELLRLSHPLAPYLINSLASVWRDPFKIYDRFSVEENMVLGAIMYGMKEKPLLMDNNLWRLTLHLRSIYFPFPFIIDVNQAIQFLTTKIVSRCAEGFFTNLWMLTSPLVIFVSKQNLALKMHFRNGYILPNLLHFSKCLNEYGFDLFCNLYVDIFSLCQENVSEIMLQCFANTSIHQDVKFVQDCAAVALLKYLGVTDKPISAPLRDWFLKNQDNPKLALIVNLYCKKVMESHDSFLLWDDIIIV